MILWRFSGCEVREFPEQGENGHLVNVFPDGAECGADRSNEMQNRDYARHLGYETVRDALREHELLHTFISERLGFAHSPTLRAVALGFAPGTAPYELQLAEEAIVLDFQRYRQTGFVGFALNPYRPMVDRWAGEFSAFLAGGERIAA